MPPDELPNGGSSDVFWDDEYGFSAMGVGAILGNGCGIQRQNYVTLVQGSETAAGFDYRS